MIVLIFSIIFCFFSINLFNFAIGLYSQTAIIDV